MTTLLRLLEPPTTESDAARDSGDKAVVFIIDEFDLFALHPRQSFLYCLLDIVQGNKRKAGVGVIGVSSRTVSSSVHFGQQDTDDEKQDCLSVLEKRVRSRCQSHVLQMAPENNFTTYLDLARSLLRVDVFKFGGKKVTLKKLATAWNAEVDAFLDDQPVICYLNRLFSLHGANASILRHAFVRLLAQILLVEADLAADCPLPTTRGRYTID